jgi:hypothetical protein
MSLICHPSRSADRTNVTAAAGPLIAACRLPMSPAPALDAAGVELVDLVGGPIGLALVAVAG